MNLLSKFLTKTEFKSYEDYYENFKVKVPENFNFAYDVIGEYASISPDKRALVWCNDEGEERVFTFSQLAEKTFRKALHLMLQKIFS